MRLLADATLLATFDKVRGVLLKTPEHELLESLTGELISNRAFFQQFGALTTYALQRELSVQATYDLGPFAKTQPSPGWTVRVGKVVKPLLDDAGDTLRVAASARAPVLGDAVRAVCVALKLMTDAPPAQPETH